MLPSSPPQQPQREPQRGEHHELQGLSFVRGVTDVPQLDETIGACLARTAQVCAACVLQFCAGGTQHAHAAGLNKCRSTVHQLLATARPSMLP